MRVLVFDTETTGLPRTKRMDGENLQLWPYIVQFSYIILDIDLNKIIKIKDVIIKIPSDISITEETSNIHGITNEISKEKGISIEIIMDEFFVDILDIDLIVAHNLSFDLNMVKCELLRLIKDNSNSTKYNFYFNEIINFKKMYCTMQESIDLCNIEAKYKNGNKYIKFPKLVELYEKLFETTPKKLHNSLNDVAVCTRCFIKLKYGVDIIENDNEITQLISCLI
jgi:DNA polymerase III epsilon subunit-like protein